MIGVVHILNGDALRSRFPVDLSGEIVVARECLVDGDVAGDDFSLFHEQRARFLAREYGVAESDYVDHVAREFKRIVEIPDLYEVNLWFEDDLFCQVNLWYVAYLLGRRKPHTTYLVRPRRETPYSFAAMTDEQLIGAFGGRMPLSPLDLEVLSQLWSCYQAADLAAMKTLSDRNEERLPFLGGAVRAHVGRTTGQGSGDDLKSKLAGIIAELGSEEFAMVFREFSRREPIYGFGDLQIARLLREMKNESGR